VTCGRLPNPGAACAYSPRITETAVASSSRPSTIVASL
jgi:hypothetical protein